MMAPLSLPPHSRPALPSISPVSSASTNINGVSKKVKPGWEILLKAQASECAGPICNALVGKQPA